MVSVVRSEARHDIDQTVCVAYKSATQVSSREDTDHSDPFGRRWYEAQGGIV